MDRRLNSLTDHYIVCGYGRLGRSLVQNLTKESIKVVAIDCREEAFTNCQGDIFTVTGNPTNDEILQELNLPHAKGLAAVFGNDSDNAYVILTAKLLAPDLPIIARASTDLSASLLRKAGAETVVCPYSTGAAKMAHVVVGNSNVTVSDQS